MKYISKFSLLILSVFVLIPISYSQQANIVTNEGEIKIAAKSKDVWKVLTNTKKYASVMGYKWKSGEKNVDAVGDQALVEFLEQQAAYEVTFLEPGQKISVKIVPSNAEYINEKIWVVIPIDKWTTRVEVTDVYTLPIDEVPPSIDQQINTLQQRLEKLRDLAERS